MKSIKKPIFFIIAAFILIFSYLTVFGIYTYHGDNKAAIIKGVKDIRWGIDIRGGVDVTFTPPSDYEGEITDNEVDAARQIIESRMISKNITDYEVYTDYDSYRIIVRFPWQASDEQFDPEAAVKELGETALLTFWEGTDRESGQQVLSGGDVKSASAVYDSQTKQYMVLLELNESGVSAFSEATGRLYQERGIISIWMDDILVSAPTVDAQISSGSATISGDFDADSAKELADKINGGALPFKLVTDSFSVIDPSMGETARDAMMIAGVIAFILMCLFMIFRYKILGVIASFGLLGQLFGSIAVISGFIGVFESFTLTIPGIAGIILSIGMGVDANVITAERIKEEIRTGKTLDGSVQSGYKRAFSAIFDGNITILIVAFILMGAFGTPDSLASKVLSPLFFAFGPSAAGSIYAFGYTLIVGVILNFIFGVFATRLMTYSIIKFKALRNPVLYGGYKSPEEKEKAQSKKVFDAVKNKKKFLMVPVVILAFSIILTFVLNLEVAIEFKGGTILNYTYSGEIDTELAKQIVEEKSGGKVNVKTGNTFNSDLSTMTVEFASNEGLTVEVQNDVSNALEEKFGENSLSPSGSQDVNPTMGKTFFFKCLVAVIFSFIVLVVYIALRFKNIGGLSAGLFAILALATDISVVYAVFVFGRFSIDANFMAVILTILCYSINDTIVVFDRIRENRILFGKRMGTFELVNLSVSQSFGRSLCTTITTCIALLVLCIVAIVAGISSMLSFALPLFVGMGFGFFTSLYMVAPLWASWIERDGGKNSKNNKNAKKAIKKA